MMRLVVVSVTAMFFIPGLVNRLAKRESLVSARITGPKRLEVAVDRRV